MMMFFIVLAPPGHRFAGYRTEAAFAESSRSIAPIANAVNLSSHSCARRPSEASSGGNWRRGSESNRRIKVLQTSPLPLGYRAPVQQISCTGLKSPPAVCAFKEGKAPQRGAGQISGAGDGGRTRDIDLGKVALYH